MTVTNTVPPAITGLARQGQTLATSNGSWTFDLDFLSYAYQWLRCDAAGANCVDIGGATASQYLLTASDVGSTIRSEVTATESAAPAPPPSTGFYGVPIPSDGLANLEIGKTARQVAHRFAASQTGTVVSVRAFLKIDDGNNYSAGNHGTIVVNMYAVDGSGHPTGASLGVTNAVVHPSNGSPTQSVWPLFTFTSPVAVTSGTRYCLVWSNTQFDQATNYCSLNDCDQPALNPRVPYASDADVAVFYRDGAGSWNTDHPERNPIHTLIYGDGEHQGNGYIDYRSGSGLLAVGGSTRARMNITPSSSQTLTDVFLFIKKSGSPSSLTVAVKQGASTVASATILAASVGTSYNWVTEALAVTLTAGINYTWELSATTGTYNIFPYQSGTPQGFTGGLLFEDGYYEFSTNGGSSWSTFSGSTAFDIPIYFT